LGNYKAFFTSLLERIKGFWGTLSAVKKAAVISVFALAIIGAAIGLSFRNPDPYEYIFVNLSPEDTQAITSQLKKSGNTDFIVDSQGIKAPASAILKLRLDLAQEGLPSQGQVGWEKFDAQEFTRTEFEQQINKLRAIQGELSRTITAIAGVTSARVHIVSPKQSLFVEDKKEPTAAIYIKTKRGVTLDKRQVDGIVHLVSKSVEGLKPHNIAIIDAEGNMLTADESQDPSTKMTKEMLTYKRNVEKELETRVRTIVGRVVGPDRVEAKVDTLVDFTQEEQTISDIDPDKVVVLAKHVTGQTISGQGLNPTGIPGAKSNIPGEQENVSASGSQANGKRDSELVNYEIAKKFSKKTLPVGSIQRISASVLVDGKQAYPVDGSIVKFEPQTAEDMKKIEELVKTAIGYKDGRDQIIVHNMLFQLDPFQVQVISEKKKENREYITTLVVSGAVALALVLFFAFIVRPYFRWLAYDPQRKKEEKLIDEFKPDLELNTIQNIQVKEDVPFEKLSPQEQILFLARHEPKRTTEAIRILLNPHQAAH